MIFGRYIFFLKDQYGYELKHDILATREEHVIRGRCLLKLEKSLNRNKKLKYTAHYVTFQCMSNHKEN